MSIVQLLRRGLVLGCQIIAIYSLRLVERNALKFIFTALASLFEISVTTQAENCTLI